MVAPLFKQRENCSVITNDRKFIHIRNKLIQWYQSSVVALVFGAIIGYSISLSHFVANEEARSSLKIQDLAPSNLRQNILATRSNHRDDFWCPNAKCINTGPCVTCKNKYLFVVATGRSGSTTTMAMLNLLPGVRISGENNDVMYRYSKLVDDLNAVPNFKVGSNVKDGCWWHEHIDTSSFACPAQELLKTINPPSLDVQMTGNDDTIITGFKEIRWLQHEEFEGDISKFIDTYHNLFPCSRFIISIRNNVEEQAKSAFYGEGEKSYSETVDYLQHLNDIHVELYSKLGADKAFLLDMNEWSAPNGAGKFDELAEWLGFKNCQYPSEIGNCWNYVNRKQMSKTSTCMTQTKGFSLGNSCKYDP